MLLICPLESVSENWYALLLIEARKKISVQLIPRTALETLGRKADGEAVVQAYNQRGIQWTVIICQGT
jgi:hypothetical protein